LGSAMVMMKPDTASAVSINGRFRVRVRAAPIRERLVHTEIGPREEDGEPDDNQDGAREKGDEGRRRDRCDGEMDRYNDEVDGMMARAVSLIFRARFIYRLQYHLLTELTSFWQN
jgi:hypothetical protein